MHFDMTSSRRHWNNSFGGQAFNDRLLKGSQILLFTLKKKKIEDGSGNHDILISWNAVQLNRKGACIPNNGLRRKIK